jgi:hypothetical protein
MAKFVVDSVGQGTVVLGVAGSNYKNTFVLRDGAEKLAPGQRVRGVVKAPAWKVDRVDLGGNYVEPLYGRPRRMQGTILAVDTTRNELVVQVGYEVTVQLPEKYSAGNFKVGERVGWDNIEMPVFEMAPAGVPV